MPFTYALRGTASVVICLFVFLPSEPRKYVHCQRSTGTKAVNYLVFTGFEFSETTGSPPPKKHERERHKEFFEFLFVLTCTKARTSRNQIAEFRRFLKGWEEYTEYKRAQQTDGVYTIIFYPQKYRTEYTSVGLKAHWAYYAKRTLATSNLSIPTRQQHCTSQASPKLDQKDAPLQLRMSMPMKTAE